jgi:hypothetical protein
MITVEEIYFKESELIRASSMDTGGYEDFMILSTERPERYGDFVTVNNIYFGDTEHHDDVMLTERELEEGLAMIHSVGPDDKEKLIADSVRALTDSKDSNGSGFVYICQREDDDFAIGVCVSNDPLRKAKIEEWEAL